MNFWKIVGEDDEMGNQKLAIGFFCFECYFAVDSTQGYMWTELERA